MITRILHSQKEAIFMMQKLYAHEYKYNSNLSKPHLKEGTLGWGEEYAITKVFYSYNYNNAAHGCIAFSEIIVPMFVIDEKNKEYSVHQKELTLPELRNKKINKFRKK